jgi:hypothetical protein
VLTGHAPRSQTHALVPPAYDSPAARVPDRVPLQVWGAQQPLERIVDRVFFGAAAGR